MSGADSVPTLSRRSAFAVYKGCLPRPTLHQSSNSPAAKLSLRLSPYGTKRKISSLGSRMVMLTARVSVVSISKSSVAASSAETLATG